MVSDSRCIALSGARACAGGGATGAGAGDATGAGAGGATAAGAGGKGTGFLLLLAFLVGLLSSNSAVAFAGVFGFLGAARNFRLSVAVSCITALFSLVIGTIFLFGGAALLPAMLGG